MGRSWVALLLIAELLACRPSSSAGGSEGSRRAGDVAPDFTCTLILGVSATGEWVDGGEFFNLVDGRRFEARTKTHAYVEQWADDPDIWTQPLDPAGPAPQPGGPPHACALNPERPDRVVFVAYTSPKNPKYQNESGWQTALESAIGAIVAHVPSAKRIELLTMVRGPLRQGGTTYPGGFNCDPTLREDIVEPYVDLAIAGEAAKNPSLVAVGPKFYVGDCSWWATYGGGRGPHFVPDGLPALEAQKIADYYRAGSCLAPWCLR